MSKLLLQNRDRRLFSRMPPLVTLTPFLSGLLKTIVTLNGCPTAALQPFLPIPSTSLPFLLLKLPAAPSSHACPCSSRFQSKGLPQSPFPIATSISVCAQASVSDALVLLCYFTFPAPVLMAALLPLYLSSDICPQNHGSLLYIWKLALRDILLE